MFLEDVHGKMELIIFPNKNVLVYNSKAGLFIATSCPKRNFSNLLKTHYFVLID